MPVSFDTYRLLVDTWATERLLAERQQRRAKVRQERIVCANPLHAGGGSSSNAAAEFTPAPTASTDWATKDTDMALTHGEDPIASPVAAEEEVASPFAGEAERQNLSERFDDVFALDWGSLDMGSWSENTAYKSPIMRQIEADIQSRIARYRKRFNELWEMQEDSTGEGEGDSGNGNGSDGGGSGGGGAAVHSLPPLAVDIVPGRNGRWVTTHRAKD